MKEVFDKIEEIEAFNSLKVFEAFNLNNVSEYHFNYTTGYGYNDVGRDVVESVYSSVFKAEDALVRAQFISGTHAISVTLSAILRPGDVMMYITGKPYDTLDPVIGLREDISSLISYGIFYKQVDLVDSKFDYDKIKNNLIGVKVVCIQRSKGYSNRKSLSISDVSEVIKFIKNINKDVIIFIDNCYCEFVSDKEPVEVGADLVVGSLIKNLGGGIVSSGAYVVGRKNLIHLVANRLNVCGGAKEVGPSFNMNREFLKGLFYAPMAVSNSLKTAVFTSHLLESKGIEVVPKFDEERVDIVQSIIFNDKELLIKYCQGIQNGCMIDSNVLVQPSVIPGYDNEIIMASGSFTQGSSIELSCDGPLREPYIAYQQGGVSYQFAKIGVLKAFEKIEEFL